MTYYPLSCYLVLAILGQSVFTAEYIRTADMKSKDVLENYYSETLIQDGNLSIENDFLHLNQLDGVLTETHFSDRALDDPDYISTDDINKDSQYRLGRSLMFIGAMMDPQFNLNIASPRVLGVDNNTVLEVSAQGIATVVGQKNAYFLWTGSDTSRRMVTNAATQMEQLNISGVHMRWFGNGSSFSLASAWNPTFVGGTRVDVKAENGEVSFYHGARPAHFGERSV